MLRSSMSEVVSSRATVPTQNERAVRGFLQYLYLGTPQPPALCPALSGPGAVAADSEQVRAANVELLEVRPPWLGSLPGEQCQ